jgi:glycosyltransferase involved in cell wall biosynthesis
MRVAVVHNLRRGGALRRLEGQLAELDADVREFMLSTGVSVTDDPVVVRHEEAATRAPRLLRPPVRYVDLVRLERSWAAMAGPLADWRPDVVFANPCHALLGAPPVLSRLGSSTVYYCDEARRVDYEDAARDSTNPATRALYGALRARERTLDRRGLAAATQVVTNSAYTADKIRRAYGRRAAVVPPGLADVFSPGEAGARRHFLSVGTLIPSKGHDLAIESVARSRISLPVHIVAPRRDEAEMERLSELARQSSVAVTFAFGVSDIELRDAYRRAVVTLYLSREEPLGLVSLESQACGTPVVVADDGGLPSTILEGVTGWAVPRTAEAAGRRLREVVDQVASMREAAIDHAARWRRRSASTTIRDVLERAAG